MTILSFKDISTGHLTDGDAAILDGADHPVTVIPYEHGWIVSTASLASEDVRDETLARLRRFGFSEPFLAAATAAGGSGCWLLRFDADADIDPDLPIGGYGGVEESPGDPDSATAPSLRTGMA
ncbi:hypothetical protein [Antarcticirhabdus aurantiaca]|uniref:Uncharacterized protein n=1 Tax=Antarcticirhabdus aurantiaca TaxID=2606717 RepID=A0ACD4NR62_9HYPH|nr:hypothetical protein [Antarcticirhabdus aurantiaca]WAJ29444.1 hypothetical protein OXU80_04185 [Jeongeuplla avenae]